RGRPARRAPALRLGSPRVLKKKEPRLVPRRGSVRSLFLAEELLQILDEPLEALLDRLLRLFDRLDPLREGARISRGGGAPAAPAGAAAASGRPARLPAAAAALVSQIAEDVDGLRIETPRPALALMGQAIGMEADVADEGRIGNAGLLADLGQ